MRVFASCAANRAHAPPAPGATREEHVDPKAALGSYAGAMGIPQFIPTSYRKFAIDGDGRGIVQTTTGVVLIGMAVGVDYSLFVLARYREELRLHADRVADIVLTEQGGTFSICQLSANGGWPARNAAMYDGFVARAKAVEASAVKASPASF